MHRRGGTHARRALFLSLFAVSSSVSMSRAPERHQLHEECRRVLLDSGKCVVLHLRGQAGAKWSEAVARAPVRAREQRTRCLR